MFEIVDDDVRTDAGACVYYKLTHEPLAQASRERLRTHKVFTKGQCFYLNYHKFYIKSYFGCVLESPR